jgi:hypothetical protein
VGVFHDLGDRVDPSRSRVPPRVASSAVEKQEPHVPASPSLRRPSTLGVVLVAVALTASACGSDDADASDKPSTSVTSSATPSATPTPTETPTTEPLSPFEDQAPVKAARAWDVAMAQSVNAHDRTLAAVAPLATARGLALSKKLAEEDIAANVRRPGPQPWTPVNVQVKGRVARLNTCYMTYGWAVARKTGKPVEKRKVEPILLEMRRVAGQWKFEYGQQGTGDCSGVRIQEVTW